MKFKTFFVIAILCFSCQSTKSQDGRKTIVCDLPSNVQDYKKWLEIDAAYIITKQEKETYLKLQINEDRQKFIDNFWERRDPNPDTEENEFKEEHYNRIAFANENFASGIWGWKTDRGLIYILFGKPDKIDKGRADFEDLKNVSFETWSYNFLYEIGSDVKLTFTALTENSEFRLPKEKREKILKLSGARLTTCFMCPQIFL